MIGIGGYRAVVTNVAHQMSVFIFLQGIGERWTIVASVLDAVLVQIEIIGELGDVHAVPRREQIVKRFKELGYKYVSLDLEGYRTGSMNEVL